MEILVVTKKTMVSTNPKMNKERGKKRWEILKTALSENVLSPQASTFSGFQGYSLFTVQKYEKYEEEQHDYFLYEFEGQRFLVRQRKLGNTFLSKEELFCSDNTGNIRIWPSEEVLGYFMLENSPLIKNSKTVIELGAGMSGIGAMCVALINPSCNVWITDGNTNCVRNLQKIVEVNKQEGFLDMGTNIQVCELLWQNLEQIESLKFFFDLVIIADCLFKEEFHESLINLLDFIVASEGMCIILAPSRGGSKNRFLNKIKEGKQFIFTQEMRFDERLWEKHSMLLEEMEKHSYEPMNHYPSLIKLSRNANKFQ